MDNTNLKKLIEKYFGESLDKDSSYDTNNPFDLPDFEEMRVKISETSNVFLLLSWWGDVEEGSDYEGVIESRIRELINEVNKNNIPEWFEAILTECLDIPYSLADDFDEVARRIYGEL